MGIKVIHSHNLSSLAAELCSQISSEPNLWQPTIVSIANAGMEQWLRREMAYTLGIVTNTIFPHQRKVFDAIAQALLVDTTGIDSHQWLQTLRSGRFGTRVLDPQQMAWQMAMLLRDSVGQYPQVDQWLERSGETCHADDEYVALATMLATIYDDRCVYEPAEMIALASASEAWQEWDTDSQRWIDSLWGRLAAQITAATGLAIHQLHPAFGSEVHCDNQLVTKFVARLPVIHIFAHAWTPPSQLQLYQGLSDAGGEIVVYNLLYSDTPQSQHNYFRSSGLLHHRRNRDLHNICPTASHQILDRRISKPPPATLLRTLQRYWVDSAEVDHTVEADGTMEIHCCANKQREIEAVRDRIIHAVQAGADPHDFVVMCPTLDDYAPYIHMVMAEPVDGVNVPYRVAERALHHDDYYLQESLAILDVIHGEWPIDVLIATLDWSIVRASWGVTQEVAVLARTVLSDLGYRWGADADHRRQLCTLDVDITVDSWDERFTLARVLKDLRRYVVIDLSTGSTVTRTQVQALGPVIMWFEWLQQQREYCGQSHSWSQWETWTRAMVEECAWGLDADDRDQLLATVAGLSRGSGPQDLHDDSLRITIRLWHRMLQAQSQQDGHGRGFLDYGVTFAHLSRVRTIPAKHLILIGMNDGEFPRTTIDSPLDPLVGRTSDDSAWRPSSVEQDRYLLVESVLNAVDSVWLFYTGHNTTTYEEKPPAQPLLAIQTILAELVDAQSMDQVWIKHSMHAGDPRNYSTDAPQCIQGVHPHWYDVAERQLLGVDSSSVGNESEDCPAPPEPADWVGLPRLQRIYKQPQLHWVRTALGVSLPDESVVQPNEPLALDALTRWKIREDLLQYLRVDPNQKIPSAQVLIDTWLSRQQLPVGDYTQVFEGLRNECCEIQDYICAINARPTVLLCDSATKAPVRIPVLATNDGYLVLSASNVTKAKYILSNWLLMLSLGSSYEPCPLSVVGLDGQSITRCMYEPTGTRADFLQEYQQLHTFGVVGEHIGLVDSQLLWQQWNTTSEISVTSTDVATVLLEGRDARLDGTLANIVRDHWAAIEESDERTTRLASDLWGGLTTESRTAPRQVACWSKATAWNS